MNESRELQICSHAHEGKPACRTDRERVIVIRDEMVKTREEIDSSYYTKLIHEEITNLYKFMLSRFGREVLIRRACTLFEYKNGGKLNGVKFPGWFGPYATEFLPERHCVKPNSNGSPFLWKMRFREVEDLKMCKHRVMKTRSVVIPARWPSADGTVEEGTVNLRDLFGKGELSDDGWRYKMGAAKFQIPNKDWLLKHRWISASEKEGPFFLREFQVLPMPFVHSTTMGVGTTGLSPLGGKNYSLWDKDYPNPYGFGRFGTFSKYVYSNVYSSNPYRPTGDGTRENAGCKIDLEGYSSKGKPGTTRFKR